jgi:hypothetical protein
VDGEHANDAGVDPASDNETALPESVANELGESKYGIRIRVPDWIEEYLLPTEDDGKKNVNSSILLIFE